jgi:glycosyltransferase involved in cell wall biosynthesis
MKPNNEKFKYVLVTAARNEEAFITKTIESVLLQTIRPLQWVIVNDGSSDGTMKVIELLVNKFDFISLINLEREGNRHFGHKAFAFRRGVQRLNNLDYQFIGNLDADIFLGPDYYENILKKFIDDPRLGIAGGIIYTKIGERFSTTDQTIDSVAGAVQLFRKECFQAIGCYIPLEYGGEDAAAEIKARMLGWRVQKFSEYRVFEQRRTGTAEAKPIIARLREGKRFYSLGYGLLYYLIRSIYRIKDPPFFIGSFAALYGYLVCYLKQQPVLLPINMVKFLRNEQLERLKKNLKAFFDKKLLY